jgi:hypothetical protein
MPQYGMCLPLQTFVELGPWKTRQNNPDHSTVTIQKPGIQIQDFRTDLCSVFKQPLTILFSVRFLNGH